MMLQDKIGRQETVDKICGLVDSLQKDQNFCLSLNGAWGSGKTFVLQMIEEQLSKKQEYVIVKYDAWENTFYDDPLIAMLYCILDTLENLASEDVLETISAGQKKKKSTEMAKKIGEAIVETAAENNKVVKFSKDAIGKVKSIIKSYKETSLATNTQTEDYKSYSTFLKQTIKQLNEISSQEVYEGKQTKLIVLVDEIDRCLPDEQLKILERMHHLFDVKNCAVIVAVNKEAIQNTFEKHYGGKSEDYFRKFFQYSFSLATNAAIFLKNKLYDLFYEINDKRKEAINKKDFEFIIADLLNASIVAIENNKIDNRDVEKYIFVAQKVVFTIIDYHISIIWFSLQMLFYRMFDVPIYNGFVDEPKDGNQIITDLYPYYSPDLKDWWRKLCYDYTLGEKQGRTYKYYISHGYNDLQFLFNVCRYRNNNQWLVNFARSLDATAFTFKNFVMPEMTDCIKSILSEIEYYGDR